MWSDLIIRTVVALRYVRNVYRYRGGGGRDASTNSAQQHRTYAGSFPSTGVSFYDFAQLLLSFTSACFVHETTQQEASFCNDCRAPLTRSASFLATPLSQYPSTSRNTPLRWKNNSQTGTFLNRIRLLCPQPTGLNLNAVGTTS